MPDTKPLFSVRNYLTDFNNVTLTSSMSELMFPKENIFDPWVVAQIHSDHVTFKIDTKNNKVNFNIGASELEATLQSGQYRPDELASEIATQMNAEASTTDITCTYDTTASKFVIAKGAGTLELLCATGTSKQASAYSSIGFDCSSDKTGALSYTASNSVNSTFGNFTIASTNNQFYFKTGGTDYAAEITAGNYSARSICSELKYQMDTEAGVTDFDVTFDESILKFRVKKGSSTFELRFAAFTTNSAADALGFPATNQTALTTVTATSRRIHTDEWVVFALSTAQQLDFVALFGYNFSATATVKLQGNASDSWSSPSFTDDFVYDSRGVMFLDPVLPTTGTRAFYRIQIIDRDNEDGYVGFGIPWGGPYFTTSRYVNWGGTKGGRTFSEISRSDQGVVAGSLIADLDTLDYEMHAISEADRANFETLYKAVQTALPFVAAFSIDHATRKYTETLYGYFTARPEYKEISVIGADYNCRLQLVESA